MSSDVAELVREADVAPAVWRTVNVSDVVAMLPGFAFKSENFVTESSDGLPLIRIRDLGQNKTAARYVGEYDEAFAVRDGDILVGMDGEFAAVRWRGGKALLNQRVLKLTSARVRDMDDGYLFYRVQPALMELEQTISGTTVKHLSTKDLKRLVWQLPPLDEQWRIAEVLQSVDEAIAAAQAVSVATRHVFVTVRAELMEAARATSDEVVVADAIAKNRGQKVKKLQTSDYLDDGAFPIIDQGAAFVCGFTDDEAALWPYDLPVIVFGDHTRILKFVDVPFVIGADGTQCITPAAGIDARYLYYALQSLDLRGEGYARHFKLLKERVVPIPTLPEQREIAERLCSLESGVAAADAATELLLEAKRALMSDLLSGRVRVPA